MNSAVFLYPGSSRLRLRLVAGEHPLDRTLEDGDTVWYQCAVLLDTLQPPPHSIPAVVARTAALAQQIGDQAVTQRARKCQDDVPVTVRTGVKEMRIHMNLSVFEVQMKLSI